MENEEKNSLLESIRITLNVIENTNRCLEIAIEGNDKLGIRQYQHLKKDFTKQLEEMLRKLNLKVSIEPLETV